MKLRPIEDAEKDQILYLLYFRISKEIRQFVIGYWNTRRGVWVCMNPFTGDDSKDKEIVPTHFVELPQDEECP